MDDYRSSVMMRGELEHAQTHEVVDNRTPDAEVMAREEAAMVKLGRLTLRQALSEDRLGNPIGEGAMEQRLEDWDVFLRYIFQGGAANPMQALKNLMAAVRRVRPQYLDGLSQTEVGMLLGETKAAVSAREIRVLESVLRRWGVLGFHGLGDTKGEETREKCRQAQMGNRNRANGAKRKRAMKEKKNGGGPVKRGDRETKRRGDPGERAND